MKSENDETILSLQTPGDIMSPSSIKKRGRGILSPTKHSDAQSDQIKIRDEFAQNLNKDLYRPKKVKLSHKRGRSQGRPLRKHDSSSYNNDS